MKLFLSIDLESWAHPDMLPFRDLSSEERKRLDNGHMVDSIKGCLDLLKKYDQQITFFISAELYDWNPFIIRKIKDSGHEIAFHSYRHLKLNNPKDLINALELSKEFLKEFKPMGFRAPGLFLTRDNAKLLSESGFHYSSSIYGGVRDYIYRPIRNFREFPVSTFVYSDKRRRLLDYPRPMQWGMLRNEIPFGSGFFLAALPVSILCRWIDKYLDQGECVFLLVHNWQVVKPQAAGYPGPVSNSLNPFHLPYTFCIKNKIEYLARRYQFGRIDSLIHNPMNIGLDDPKSICRKPGPKRKPLKPVKR